MVDKPGPLNTGARIDPNRTLTGAAAITEALANGRALSGARITGLTLDQAAHAGLTFTDCIIEGSSSYVLRSFFGSTSAPAPTGGERNTFDHCTIRPATPPTSGAVVVGSYLNLIDCDVSGGIDLAKPVREYTFTRTWFHDTWHTDTAHCDVVQIVNGGGGLVEWCNLSGFNHPASPIGGGQPCSGVLQTGTLTADVTATVWADNWVDGGGYSLRAANTKGLAGYMQSLTFRRNRFGRGFRYGPTYAMGTVGVDFDSSNVWDDDGTAVR